MKLTDIMALLASYADAIAAAGAADSGRILTDFVIALSRTEAQSLPQLGKLIKRADPSGGREATDGDGIARVLEGLNGLKNVLSRVGAKAAIKDLATLEQMLATVHGLTMGQFSACLTAASVSAKPKSVKKTGQDVDRALVARLADSLMVNNSDDRLFKLAVQDMKNMKLSKATVDAICDIYLGREQPIPSKSISEAFKKIEERHFLDALSESRGRAIERINI
jgi:hypothetical protein